eukprot:m.108827 g.108827  ORF g.108827 m.108827 type:complete len:127 (-) comp51751_c0_seq10:916-1296(-)
MSGEGIRRRFVEFDGSSRAQTASTLSRNASTEPLEALLALGSDPTCSENPQILQELGLEEKDIPVLLDMVIDSELDTIGDGWTRVHAIHVLTHFTDVRCEHSCSVSISIDVCEACVIRYLWVDCEQ